MARLLAFLALAFIPWVEQANGQAYPFCQSKNKTSSGPKLPSLPNAFIAEIGATFVNRNYSMLFTEYYDKEANRGAVRRIKDGQSSYSIYNYNENEMMRVDTKNKNCTVMEISTMHGHPFFGRNSSRIESTADLFRFGAEFNESFIGNETIRGIPCYHWQACLNHKHHSYLVDYYFSIPGWSMPNSKEMQVVRATLNGTAMYPSNMTGPGHIRTNHSFFHIYDFYSFEAAKPQPEAFMIPRGVFCSGMKDKKPVPKMPPVFTLEIESVHPMRKNIGHFKEYYDFNRKLVMFQFYDYRHKGYGETRILHDFHHHIKYNISGMVCQNVSQLTLNNTRWDGKESKDHQVQMMTPTEMMFLHANKSATVYAGSARVRDIDTDVWVFKRKSVYRNQDMISEYYFSKPQWNMRAGSRQNQTQVVVKINTYWPNMTLISSMNVLNFDGEPVPLHVFSIAPCYPDARTISLRFKGDWRKLVHKQQMQFNIAVRDAVAKASKVAPIRVDGLKNGKGDGTIIVWFTLLGKPPVKPVKPTLNSPPNDPPTENDLKKAIEDLKKTVMAGDLTATWKNPITGEDRKLTADKDYFYDALVIPTTKPPPPDSKLSRKRKGVPGGAVAGIAFLMIAIGVCIGLGVAHFIMKRRGDSLFRYQRQA